MAETVEHTPNKAELYARLAYETGPRVPGGFAEQIAEQVDNGDLEAAENLLDQMRAADELVARSITMDLMPEALAEILTPGGFVIKDADMKHFVTVGTFMALQGIYHGRQEGAKARNESLGVKE